MSVHHTHLLGDPLTVIAHNHKSIDNIVGHIITECHSLFSSVLCICQQTVPQVHCAHPLLPVK